MEVIPSDSGVIVIYGPIKTRLQEKTGVALC